METKKGVGSKKLTLIYEMIGTALLTIALNWSGERNDGGISNKPDPEVMAITLFASMIIFGQISGGHFNPAVTIGIFLQELITEGNYHLITYALSIIASQILGAVIGVTFVGLTLTTEVNKTRQEFKTSFGLNMLCSPHSIKADVITDSDSHLKKVVRCNIDQHHQWISILLTETVCTASFVGVILMIKYGVNSNEGILKAFCVSLAFFVMLRMSLTISGGCLNTAISLVQSIFQVKMYSKVMDPDNSWLHNHNPGVNDEPFEVSYRSMAFYTVGSLFGGIIAGVTAPIHTKILSKSQEKAEIYEASFGILDQIKSSEPMSKSIRSESGNIKIEVPQDDGEVFASILKYDTQLLE